MSDAPGKIQELRLQKLQLYDKLDPKRVKRGHGHGTTPRGAPKNQKLTQILPSKMGLQHLTTNQDNQRWRHPRESTGQEWRFQLNMLLFIENNALVPAWHVVASGVLSVFLNIAEDQTAGSGQNQGGWYRFWEIEGRPLEKMEITC